MKPCQIVALGLFGWLLLAPLTPTSNGPLLGKDEYVLPGTHNQWFFHPFDSVNDCQQQMLSDREELLEGAREEADTALKQNDGQMWQAAESDVVRANSSQCIQDTDPRLAR